MAADDRSHGCKCVVEPEAASLSPDRREAEDCEADAGAGSQCRERGIGQRSEREPGISLEATV